MEAKEIRLFGEKSLREDAYRHKILYLEREIARLEALAKESQIVNPNSETKPIHLEGLYYESLLSFDKRVKREQDFLEKRATEIAERLDLQARRLALDIESSLSKKIKWLVASVFVTGATLFFIFVGFFLFYKGGMPSYYTSGGDKHVSEAGIFYKGIPYIKEALQARTIYCNQYEVKEIGLFNGAYVVEINLNFQPTDKWYLKNLAQELVEVLQRYNPNAAAEISFLYDGKVFLRTHLSKVPPKTWFQYFY